MKKWLFFCLIGLASSCNERIVSFVNPTSAFKSYHSYSIVYLKATKTNQSDGSVILKNIEQNIDQQMNKRGYEKSTIDPDLAVRYELISNQRVEDQNNQPLYTPRVYTAPRILEESVLLLEINDVNKRKIVWQASIDLKRFSRSRDKTAVIDEAITLLYNSYLYKAGNKYEDQALLEER